MQDYIEAHAHTQVYKCIEKPARVRSKLLSRYQAGNRQVCCQSCSMALLKTHQPPPLAGVSLLTACQRPPFSRS